MRNSVFHTFLPALLITVAHTAPVTRGTPPATAPAAGAREGTIRRKHATVSARSSGSI